VSCPIPYRQTALEALQAWPGGLQLGGGVTTDNAMEYLDAGASHVIVTSFVFREGRLEEERLQQLVRWVGWACRTTTHTAGVAALPAPCLFLP
jgi:phosphoribosylformimino-5-aminoimidazole carboxamide ribonucleotide (ProFAR) isomerase